MEVMGIYEKALPKDIDWMQRLQFAKDLGFQFVEMSIDESDKRLARLNWNKNEIKEVKNAIDETGIYIFSICLSGHRRFPFGSKDPNNRKIAMEMMERCVNLAVELGVRNIQLAGYDVYYEDKTDLSREYFIENLREAVKIASAKQVMLSIEIMDDPFINSITKFKQIKKQIPSPWLQLYLDIGNLSAWPENNVGYELELGIDNIVAIHLKDTVKVSDHFQGKFKEVPWGEGDVDFLGTLKTLKRLNYNGPFLIEMWSEKEENPLKAIQDAQDYLYPILKEAGYDSKRTNHR